MKKILLILVLLTTSSYGAIIPVPINSGEVKIIYPCSILDQLPKESEESLEVIFFETEGNKLTELGLNYRYRKKSNLEDDVTLKFRPSRDQMVMVEEDIYSELSSSSHGELKCEADVIYDKTKPKFVSTCSFKSSGSNLTKEHDAFLKMVQLTPPALSNLREVKVSAFRWKLTSPDSFFKKRPTIEVWRFRQECILEVSTKFEGMEKAVPALRMLKALIPFAPSLIQGNKTSQVLQTKVR